MTLAYSEHLFAQAVQILPVYALTGNIVLCYNLLFLSTFVLSGLGTFLFVREVTGSRAAAFFAGVVYAFAPYRVPQFAHLQVLSSQWMPFALFGLRRYFERCQSGERRAPTFVPLAGAVAALIAQNLSNGYYLLFFSPFRRRLRALRDRARDGCGATPDRLDRQSRAPRVLSRP